MTWAQAQQAANAAVLAAFADPADAAGQRVRLGWDWVDAAVFEQAHAIGAAGTYGMASASPSVVLPTALVPANVVGLPCDVGTTRYTVMAHQPDGMGLTRLLLEVA